ncbi:acyl-CoA N-acyltransferase [Mrakia frigida]|uniref:acyl-CoA N-acyltransferase n=1 Tax=Mrakia frigida TaxID=29902 RepID=UPI003FCBFD6A
MSSSTAPTLLPLPPYPSHPFTSDSSLHLLFDRSLLPSSVIADLPEQYHIRPLATTDVTRGHIQLLSILSVAPELSQQQYDEIVEDMLVRGRRGGYYPTVIVSRETDQIVATGTLLVERKFIRGGGLVGHIEDIAVSSSAQGRKLGLRIIQALVGISEGTGCYKTILDCNRDNIAFYEKCGFAQKEYEMAKYAPASGVNHPAPATFIPVPDGKKGNSDYLSPNL